MGAWLLLSLASMGNWGCRPVTRAAPGKPQGSKSDAQPSLQPPLTSPALPWPSSSSLFCSHPCLGFFYTILTLLFKHFSFLKYCSQYYMETFFFLCKGKQEIRTTGTRAMAHMTDDFFFQYCALASVIQSIQHNIHPE